MLHMDRRLVDRPTHGGNVHVNRYTALRISRRDRACGVYMYMVSHVVTMCGYAYTWSILGWNQ